ncbi:MAG: peptidylprolyl isomerase [Emergencia sp.]|nr:peptidylprolyl isomerase [Emergencia sp.]
MRNPIATIHLNNGKKIVMELRPDYAYNEVCSFISAAEKGYYNHFAIQRIVPGSWIDASYNAFFRKECQYFLPNRIAEECGGQIKTPEPGDACLGYFSDEEIAGTEFFFPLRTVEELTGKCPVFAQVTEGMEEHWRMEKVETYPNPFEPVEINVPRRAEIMVRVEIETFGESYPEPDKIFPAQIPDNWPVFAE